MKLGSRLVAACIIAFLQAGCTTLVIGGGTSGGGSRVAGDQRTAGEISNDRTITSVINSKYVNDDLVSAFDVNVNTYQGVVTLNGTVSTRAAASRAVVLARDTRNVKRVISHIAVRP